MPKRKRDGNNPEATVISFYSHKGGVGKTTSVREIGSILSKHMGYRVLLVDADPQCSLSTLLLRNKLSQNNHDSPEKASKDTSRRKSTSVRIGIPEAEDWYTDEQVDTLLEHYLGDIDDIELLTAMLGTDWERGNDLKDNLLEFILQRQFKIDKGGPVKNKVIIPVNLNQVHWSLLCIVYSDNAANSPDIKYFDPLNNPLPESLKRILSEEGLFANPVVSILQERRIQQDGYNCGPWIIEAARAIGNSLAIPGANHPIAAARAKHITVLTHIADELLSEEDNNTIFEESLVKHIHSAYENKNIYDALKFIDRQNLDIEFGNSLENTQFIEPDASNPNLFLLAGNRAFAKLDLPMNMAYSEGEIYQVYQGIMAVPCNFLRQFGKKHGFDIVLVDLNPGSTILNASILLGSNYISVPIMPDHYSKQAIWSLSNIMPAWEAKIKKERSAQLGVKHFPINPPLFLGVIPQRVQLSSGTPTTASKVWLDAIEYELDQSLLPKLERMGMIKDSFKKFPSFFIRRFHADMTRAQQQCVPTFMLSDPQDPKHAQSIYSDYSHIIFSLFMNMKPEDQDKFDFAEKLKSIKVDYASAVKLSVERTQKQEDGALRFNSPLPIKGAVLKGFLLGKSQEQEFLNAVVYEIMHIEPRVLQLSKLFRYEKFKNYYNRVKMLQDAFLVHHAKVRKFTGKLKRVHRNEIRDLVSSIDDVPLENLSERLEQLVADIEKELGKSKLNVMSDDSTDEKDALQNDIQQLQAFCISIQNLINDIKGLVKSCSEQLHSTDVYEKFIHGWLFNNRSSLSYYQIGDKSLLHLIAKNLGVQITVQPKVYGESSYTIGPQSHNKYKMREVSGGGYMLIDKNQPLLLSSTIEAEDIDLLEPDDDYIKKWLSPSPNPAETVEPKVISMFNHKGGVAKTTTCINIAYMLAKRGLKVILIDADTQCNLSSMLMGNDYFDFHAEQKQSEIKQTSVLKQTFSVMQQASKKQGIASLDIKLYQTVYENLLLLPGSTLHFLDVENWLTRVIKTKMENVWDNYHAEANFPRHLAKAFGVDIVIIDMSPAISSTNQALLVNSDYYIMPYLADYLSLEAIRSMPSVFVSWVSEIYQYHCKESSGAKFNVPQLLQVIPQKYGLASRKSKTSGYYKTTKVPSKYQNECIEKVFEFVDKPYIDEMHAEIQKLDLTENEKRELNAFIRTSNNLKIAKLAGIPDYQSYGLRAQTSYSTVLTAPDDYEYRGNMSIADFRKNKRFYQSRYSQIVNDLLEKTRLIVRLQPKKEQNDQPSNQIKLVKETQEQANQRKQSAASAIIAFSQVFNPAPAAATGSTSDDEQAAAAAVAGQGRKKRRTVNMDQSSLKP